MGAGFLNEGSTEKSELFAPEKALCFPRKLSLKENVFSFFLIVRSNIAHTQ